MRLLAETSGKNALVITAAADEDAAIRDLVRSAFGHAGQKCSAASLAIVEGIAVRRSALPAAAGRRGAQRARRRGRRPGNDDGAADRSRRRLELLRALTELDPGESWLVEPQCIDAVPPPVVAGSARWACARIVVPPHRVLRARCSGSMRADDLDHAIAIQNAGRLRPHRRHPLARRARGRALARSGRGRQRLREPPHHRRDRAAATVRRLEALVGRLRPEGRRARVRRGVRHVDAAASTIVPSSSVSGTSYFCVDRDPSGLAANATCCVIAPLPRVGLLRGAPRRRSDVELAIDGGIGRGRRSGRPRPRHRPGRDRRRPRPRPSCACSVTSTTTSTARGVRTASISIRAPVVAIAEVELRRWCASSRSASPVTVTAGCSPEADAGGLGARGARRGTLHPVWHIDLQ